MTKTHAAAAEQYTRALPSLDAVPLEFDELRRALSAHNALASLIGHCMQHLDGSDDSIPVPPDPLASLLEAANAQVAHIVEKLEGEQAQRRMR